MRKSSIKTNSKQRKYEKALWGIGAVSLALVALFPLFVGSYYMRFTALIFLYAIIAMGYNIASGYCGMTTFSTAAFYGIGAYSSAIMITRFELGFVPALLIGIVITCLFSLIVSLSASKTRGLYLALISLGLLEIVTRILVEWQDVTGGAMGFYLPGWEIFGFKLDANLRYYVILIMLVLGVIVQRNIVKSHWGRSFLSIANNEVAAAGVGVYFRRYRVYAFLISAVYAGVAGSMYASFSGYLSPDTFGFSLTVFFLLICIVGGLGTLTGPLIGAVIATVFPEFFSASPDLKQLMYGGLLIVLTQLMPTGVVGLIKRRYREIDDNKHIQETAPGEEKAAFDFSVVKPAADDDDDENIMVIKGLTKEFGGLVAVNNLDMVIRRGKLHSLIGPNGAGKTTAVNMITGIERPTSGQVIFSNKDITGVPIFKLARQGIARTYQHVRLFNKLSVLENIIMGTRLETHYSISSAILRTPKMRRLEKKASIDALKYLDMIGLAEKANTEPESLSAGQQKLLELARALSMKPTLLVLDEPCAGLTETETSEFAEVIKKIRDAGVSILLIEHHMSLVMDISDDITVLDYGKKIAEGNPEEVSSNPLVKKAYLGEEE